MIFCDWLVHRCRAINALVQPCVEALEGLVGIVGLPELLVALGQVRSQDPCVVLVQLDQELERGCLGIACEGVLGGREVGVVERHQYLIADCSVNVTTFIVLSELLVVLAEEQLLAKGGSPCRDVGCTTGVGRADE